MNTESSDRRIVYRGFAVLLLATLLWGSSFPAIKFVVVEISEYTYVWFRGLVAITGLTPYVLYRFLQKKVDRETTIGGLITGTAYAIGLWLQGWGTRYTMASNSAFITGLNVVFVHLYSMLLIRRYSMKLAASLASAIMGLYLLTEPISGFGFGESLVLAGAFFWAIQIILIDRFCEGDPLLFTYFEMMPALLFVVPSSYNGIIIIPHGARLIVLIYLGLACSDIAFALQVYGQRFIEAAVAGIIFLFEPVFASLMAWLTLGETLKPLQVVGASLILLSIFLSSINAAGKKVD